MESSEEGTTRLPPHSDVAGPAEHSARSQERHRLPSDPAVEWGPGLGGALPTGTHGPQVEAEHLPQGQGSLIGVQSELLLRMFSPSHVGNVELVFSDRSVFFFRMSQPCKKGDLR